MHYLMLAGLCRCVVYGLAMVDIAYIFALFYEGLEEEFPEDDLSLFNINQMRDLKCKPKAQAPWCRPLKHHDKVPYKVPSFSKKGAAYRIQQPRPTVM